MKKAEAERDLWTFKLVREKEEKMKLKIAYQEQRSEI